MTVSLQEHRRVHFVGIGGIGMSALARLLLWEGYEVSGSDRSPGEQGQALQKLGARVLAGHEAQHVDSADLVVMTSAVAPDNVEISAARAKGIPVIKRSEMLAAIVNPRRGVAIAGTHGKTTTSALIAHILTECDLDPTVLIGGISANLGSNARIGRSNLVVAEADEYDASFLRLRPHIGVILNVEPDHLDFYGTVDAVHNAFRTFAGRVTDTLVVCADDPVAMEASSTSQATVVTYGIERGDWRATDIREHGRRTHFSVRHDHVVQEYQSALAGRHNVLNALAAMAVAHSLRLPPDETARALATFRGVGRRTEEIGEAGNVLVMDDYAHHPSEIRTVLRALRDRYRRPIRVIFQPHTYTRTKAFLSDFAIAFEDADAVYLLDIYAARETDTLGISGVDLARATQRHHAHAVYVETPELACRQVLDDVQPGDLVITMGAGDVYRLAPDLLQGLSRR